MGIIIRQSFKSSIVSYIGLLIGVINVLFVSTTFLTSEQIGLTQAILSYSIIFSTFSAICLPGIINRFFAYYKSTELMHNGFFTFLIVIGVVGSLIFVIVFYYLEFFFRNIYFEKSPLLFAYYNQILFLTVLVGWQGILEAYIRAHLRIVVPAIIREIILRLINIALIIMFGFHWLSLSQFINLWVLSYLIINLLLIIYINFLGKFFLITKFNGFSKSRLKEMFNYGLLTTLPLLSWLIIYKVESIFLPAYSKGLSNLGIFTIASQFALAIEIPRRTVSQISLPILAEAWKNNNIKNINEVYKKSSLNLLIIGLFLFLGIWLNIDDIFSLLPQGKFYQTGKFVVFWIGLARVVDMATGVNSEILSNSKYYKYDFIFIIFLSVVITLLNYFLIPIYNINGAALSTFISILIYNVAKLLLIFLKTNLNPFNVDTIMALGIGLITFVIVFLTPLAGKMVDNHILNIFIRSITISIIFGFLVLISKVSPDINQLVSASLKKIYFNDKFK